MRQMVPGAVPVEWLRCTNKTDDAESGDAYHPRRGCLTAGVAAGARSAEVTYIPDKFLQPCTIFFFIAIILQ